MVNGCCIMIFSYLARSFFHQEYPEEHSNHWVLNPNFQFIFNGLIVLPQNMYKLGKLTKYAFGLKNVEVLDLSGRNSRLMDTHYFKYRSIYQQCMSYVDEQFIFGREAYVVSTGISSLKSTIQGLCVLDQFNFETVLLDRYNMRDLDRMINQEQQLYGLSDENLLGKSKFTTYFTKFMPNQRKYFHIHPQNIIYRVNDETECLYFEDQLAIAYFVCDKNKKRNIILSKPDMGLFIEDFVMQLSLEEMQSIFHESLKNIEIKSTESKLLDHQSDVLGYLLEQVKKNQGKRVFQKWSLYNASLIHKCNRIFKGSASFTDQYFCQNVVDMSQQPVLPEYDQIFRSFQIKDYPQKAKKVLNPEVEQDLFHRALHEDKMILIEKYVLASYLVGQDLRILAFRGQDIFSSSLFKGKLTTDDQEAYLMMHQKYGDLLQRTQNKILVSFEESVRSRKFVNSYSQQIDKIENKAKEHQYKFDIHGLSKLKSQLALATAFHTQMDNIIKQRQEAGITQFETVQALKQIKEGNFTEQSLRSYVQLLHDTNVSLGFPLKFPRMLAPITMSYVSNNERLRLADQYAYQEKPRIIEGLEILHEKALTNKPEPSIANLLKEADFSDEEEQSEQEKNIANEKKSNMDDLHLQKFVLGAPDSTSKFPYDISKLSEEELVKLGFQVVGQKEIQIKNGQIISNSKLDPEVEKEIKEFTKKN